MTVFGFDVNHYKSDVPAKDVVAHGYPFFMAKASEGATYRDPSFSGFKAAAASSGALFAGYHYLRGDSSVASQAKNAFAAIGDPTLPLIIDIERTNGSPQPSMSIANSFAAAYKSLGGTVSRLLYLPGWYWSESGRPSVAGWSLWQSAYGSNGGGYPGDKAPGWTYTNGGTVSVLQYTSNGILPGYSGKVDLNAFRGTRDQLAATGWFKDYKKVEDVPLSADDLANIQKAVAATPIVIDGSGTTAPLQKVLRQILSEPAPSADEIAKAVISGYGSGVYGATYAEVQAAVASVLKSGVDAAPAGP